MVKLLQFARTTNLFILFRRFAQIKFRIHGFYRRFYGFFATYPVMIKESIAQGTVSFEEIMPSDTSGKTADSHRKKLPSLKALWEEYAELTAQKKAGFRNTTKRKMSIVSF